MFECIKANSFDADIIVMSAAVADFTSDKAVNKIKKNGQELVLNLKPTQDILKYLGQNKRPGQILVGYCMETIDLLENAKQKLINKNCDFIIANTISNDNKGFNMDDNEVYIISKDNMEKLPKMSKENIARIVLEKCEREIKCC